MTINFEGATIRPLVNRLLAVTRVNNSTETDMVFQRKPIQEGIAKGLLN